MSKKIVARECRFVLHLPAIKNERPDTHIIKEVLHYDDNTTSSDIRLVKNMKRDFYVTKEFFRNHKDKKETEELSKLDKFSSTESELANNVARRLGMTAYFRNNIRDVRDSPYIYGIDIRSTTIIKNMYMSKYDVTTPYTIATYDIEINTDNDNITIISVCMEDKIWTGFTKAYFKNKIPNDLTNKLTTMFEKYIPDCTIKGLKVEYELLDTEIDLIKKSFIIANEWKPDILAIWNIEFDIKKIMERVKKLGYKMEDAICDTRLPKEYRHFKYIEGSKQRLTESGKFTPINQHEQWHTVDSSTTFYIIDAMLAYNYIRVGGKQLPGGYGLDNVLNKHLKLGKLKFSDVVELKGVEWHKFMSENRPLEYIIYNQWDVMGMVMLDMETKDLNYSLPLLAGVSDFKIFNSGPKKIVDAMYFFFLTKGKVLGTKPLKVEDDKILGLSGWISILLPYRLKAMGLNVTEDSVNEIIENNRDKIDNVRDRRIPTNIFGLVADLDITSAYPNASLACNVSKSTTLREIKKIKGIPKDIFRIQNLNILLGKCNSVEYCTTMLNFPTLTELKKQFLEQVE